MRALICCVIAAFSYAPPARANNPAPVSDFLITATARDPWRPDWMALNDTPATSVHKLDIGQTFAQSPAGQPLHPAAIEHSSGYQARAKIHKYASFATLPLFASELALGQSLYNSSSEQDSKKGLHAAIGAGIIGLFGVNTVTGSWNLFGEGWQEKDGRALRLVHGLLMMAANAGFVATWATAPHREHEGFTATFADDKSTHRNIAFASISAGTAGYLVMFLANHH